MTAWLPAAVSVPPPEQSDEYRSVKKKQDDVTSEFQKASLSVSEMTNEFSTVSDALEELKVRCRRVCQVLRVHQDGCVRPCVVVLPASRSLCVCGCGRAVSLQSQMDSRGSSMTDTSPLMKIKEALTNLRTEIKSMELRIGVVGHTLMQSKLKYVCVETRENNPHPAPRAVGMW